MNPPITLRKALAAVALLLFPLILPAQKYLGADISLLPSYEKQNTLYRNSRGKLVRPLKFFRQQGWNTMRVRLFVNPDNAPEQHKREGVVQDLNYALQLSERIKKAGFKLLLDFHYSDTWADPAKQYTPKSWQLCDSKALADSVYTYTNNVLNTFVDAGVSPDLIQVGNEITFGMLWPTGKVDPMTDDNWPTFISLLNSGIKACRDVCPEAKVIIHTERAGEWEMTKNYYNKLREHNVDYDIIGLSYYPMWHKTLDVLKQNLYNIEFEFPDKDIIIAETAFYYSHDKDVWCNDPKQYSEYYPISKEGQRLFISELISELNLHNRVTGLFWWMAEENGYKNNVIDSWINRGLFDNRTGKALPALYEMRKFK